MPHSARKLLLDVSLACQEIMEFTEGKSYEEFQEDRLLQLAIEREFESTVVSSSKVRKLPTQILESATYKLDILNAATSLDDLRSPPGNRLEALRGDYKGHHSIRINAQWRVEFRL